MRSAKTTLTPYSILTPTGGRGVEGRSLARSVVVFVDEGSVEKDEESLAADVDGETDVFVNGFRRSLERLTEDIEDTLAAYKADKVVAAMVRLGQRIVGRFGDRGKTERCSGGFQGGKMGVSPTARGVLPPSLL